jgi:hypothetical protein
MVFKMYSIEKSIGTTGAPGRTEGDGFRTLDVMHTNEQLAGAARRSLAVTECGPPLLHFSVGSYCSWYSVEE